MTVPTNLPPPSRNPGDDDGLDGVFRLVLRKFLQQMDDMLPARVIAYNSGSNRAQVQPLISMVQTDATIIQRAPILSVPVQQFSGGGFVLRVPIAKGDLGFIKANDRDISLFLQSLQMSIPNTGRKHSFSDAIFLPMALVQMTVAASDLTSISMQTIDGTMRIALSTSCALITDDPTYTPAVSAVMDVQSRKGAFKFPVMTQTQKNAISTPQPGFAVFDSTLNRLSVYATGMGWS